MVQHTDHDRCIEAPGGIQIRNSPQDNLYARRYTRIQQVCPCQFKHRWRGIDSHEGPLWLQPCRSDNFTCRSASADNQQLRWLSFANGGRKHAGSEFMASVVSSQGDPTLVCIFRRSGRVEFGG